MGRQLGPEERALWQRVTATVRALHPGGGQPVGEAASAPPVPDVPRRSALPAAIRTAAPAVRPEQGLGETLDGSWDRRLRHGTVAPDRTIDLHGHTLSHAHAAIDAGLADALARGERVLLVITGRPPRDDRPGGRGAIRGALGHWLAASRHAGRIAAVRGAHRRHGGAGALYIVLRRNK